MTIKMYRCLGAFHEPCVCLWWHSKPSDPGLVSNRSKSRIFSSRNDFLCVTSLRQFTKSSRVFWDWTWWVGSRDLKISITGWKNLWRARNGSNPWARVGEGPQQRTTGENTSVTSGGKYVCKYLVLLNFPPTNNNLHLVQWSSCSIGS